MANEPEYGPIQRLSRFCGLALVVFVVAGLVYLAPLAVLARIEDPNGGNRFLGSKTYIPRAFTDEAKKLAVSSQRMGIHPFLLLPIHILEYPLQSGPESRGRQKERTKQSRKVHPRI